MLAYLAGPMTGRPDFNYPTFLKAAGVLRENGVDVICPAETAGGVTHLPLRTYMEIDVGYVKAAEAIVMLPGWESSKGAKLEIILATQLGMPVYEYNEVFGIGRELEVESWTVQTKVASPHRKVAV